MGVLNGLRIIEMAEETDSRLSFKDNSQSHSTGPATLPLPKSGSYCHSCWLQNPFILITAHTSKIDAPAPAFQASDWTAGVLY